MLFVRHVLAFAYHTKKIHSFFRSFIHSFIHSVIHSLVIWSRKRAACVMTKLWSWTIRDSISGRHRIYRPCLKRPHQLCGPPSTRFSPYWRTLSGVQAAVPWSLPLTAKCCHVYACTEWSGATVPFTLITSSFNGFSVPQIIWCGITGWLAYNKQGSAWKIALYCLHTNKVVPVLGAMHVCSSHLTDQTFHLPTAVHNSYYATE
jgi:hypothetical protein